VQALPPDPQPAASAQGVDPDRPAAARRRWVAFVPLTALAAGLLFAASASTAQGTDLRADRRLRLTELIAREEQAVERQEQAAAGLRRSVAQVSDTVAQRDTLVAAAQAPAELEFAAGLVPLRGPAVTVSLDDAPQRPGRPALSEDPDDLVVHQQDVQAVVNALWAGGAEAMTLMGQRVVSTSAVRCVGNTVILHGRVYSPPFVVTAIGDPARLQQALDEDPGVAYFRTFVERFSLGYDVTTQDDVTLPAYEGTLELPHVDGRTVQ
jgi:uncharacterized protein YlxW (UPF0749 family)